jgi:hypothetical protein
MKFQSDMMLPVKVSSKSPSWNGVGRSALSEADRSFRFRATGKDANDIAAMMSSGATVLDQDAIVANVVELMWT